jgi:hypothetical protein
MPPILSSIAIATAKAYGFTGGGIAGFTANFLVIAGGGSGGQGTPGNGGGGGAGGYRQAALVLSLLNTQTTAPSPTLAVA